MTGIVIFAAIIFFIWASLDASARRFTKKHAIERRDMIVGRVDGMLRAQECAAVSDNTRAAVKRIAARIAPYRALRLDSPGVDWKKVCAALEDILKPCPFIEAMFIGDRIEHGRRNGKTSWTEAELGFVGGIDMGGGGRSRRAGRNRPDDGSASLAAGLLLGTCASDDDRHGSRGDSGGSDD